MYQIKEMTTEYDQILVMRAVKRTGGTMENSVMGEVYVVVLRWQ